MERPYRNDDGLPPDPPPGSDPNPAPRYPKSPDPKVTPLDEDKNLEDGIEVNET